LWYSFQSACLHGGVSQGRAGIVNAGTEVANAVEQTRGSVTGCAGCLVVGGVDLGWSARRRGDQPPRAVDAMRWGACKWKEPPVSNGSELAARGAA
jgi:hypothetical protein